MYSAFATIIQSILKKLKQDGECLFRIMTASSLIFTNTYALIC